MPRKLLPNKRIRERYGICDMTRRRWRQSPTLNFPQPTVRINDREYTDEAELDAFDERQRAVDGADG